MRSGAGDRVFFGGSSDQQQTTDQSQIYTDSRSATQNSWQTRTDTTNTADSHDTTGSFNTSSLSNWLSSTTNSQTNTNSGNTSAQWWQANNDSHATTNSGNTSKAVTNTTTDSGNTSSLTQWLSSLTNNTSNSGNTTVTDGRNLASTTTDSRSTVINYTGLDGGVGTIAAMVAQSLGAVADSNATSVRELARYGAAVGDNAADLAAMSQANSMRLSTHMLDLTGDLIGRMATGAALSTAAQVDVVRTTAARATEQNKASDESTIKAAWIAGGLAVLAVLMR